MCVGFDYSSRRGGIEVVILYENTTSDRMQMTANGYYK